MRFLFRNERVEKIVSFYCLVRHGDTAAGFDCVCLSPVEAAQTGISLEYDYNFLSAFCGEHMLIQFNARSGVPVRGNFMLSEKGALTLLPALISLREI